MNKDFVSKEILTTKCEMSIFIWLELCLLRIKMLYELRKYEKQP